MEDDAADSDSSAFIGSTELPRIDPTPIASSHEPIIVDVTSSVITDARTQHQQAHEIVRYGPELIPIEIEVQRCTTHYMDQAARLYSSQMSRHRGCVEYAHIVRLLTSNADWKVKFLKDLKLLSRLTGKLEFLQKEKV